MGRLKAEQVLSIRDRFTEGETKSMLAMEFGVSWQNINLIVTGKTWTDPRNFR
jgi:hypothetical protein